MALQQTREANDRSFRRGAVMGLTIAETFVLLIFCLLLLFFLWQLRQDRDDRVRDGLAQDPAYAETLRTLAADGTIDAVLDLRANGIDVRDLSGFAEAEDYWRFISEPELRRLMQGAVRLDEPALVSLADSVTVPEVLARIDQLGSPETGPALDAFLGLEPEKQALFLDISSQDTAATLAALQDAAAALPPDDTERLLALLARLAAAPDLLDLLETTAALPPADQAALSAALASLGATALADQVTGISQAEAQIRNINIAIAEAAAQEDALIGSLQADLGGVVRGIGGEIRTDGTIVLPESVGFLQGRADIQPKLRDFLHRTCAPWITLLRDSGLDIGTVEIQGHASPEWRTDTSEDAAYRNNLRLSQERARNVLEACLDDLSDPALAAWARTHLVAVGYSSGRPVAVDGAISDDLSRRVEFSFQISRDSILEDIRTEMTAPAP